MTIILWSDDFCTGIRAIDNDHKGLFEAMNLLYDAHLEDKSPEQVYRVLVLLNNYVNDHFSREEHFLVQAGYPETKEHRKLHKQFRDDLNGLRTLYHSEPESVNVGRTVSYLFQWVKNHIVEADKEYVPYLRGEKEGDHSIQDDEADLFHLSIRVPKEHADTIENFIDVVVEHGMTENLERMMLEMQQEKENRARSIFT